MRTHRNPSTAITRKSPGIRKRGTTALVLDGVIERHWIAETQQRHYTVDVIEGKRASETTLRTDTICVEGVAEGSHAAETTPRRLCAAS
jgi:hypothetical protein